MLLTVILVSSALAAALWFWLARWRIMRILAVLPFILVSACGGIIMSLPDEYVVNAPVMQQLFGWGGGIDDEQALLARLTPPAGWELSIWARDLAQPRLLEETPQGAMLVSVPRAGQIVYLRGDNKAEVRRVLLEGLDRPHGMALVDIEGKHWLYVAESGQVRRFQFDEASETITSSGEVIFSDFPEGGNHWTRTLKQGPDGQLYLAVGSSCNVCEEEDLPRAAMMVLNVDGSEAKIYASGLRNTVGWDWQPKSGDLYGVDNGRDLLGDDFPPCELNLIKEGGFYGWPYYNANNVPDPDLGSLAPAGVNPIAPVHDFPPHSAPLALRFINVGARGLEKGDALVSLHGSWNRSRKIGYEIVRLRFTGDGIKSEQWLSGFEQDEDVIGRPVDIVEREDGAIFITDDYAGAIYLLRPQR